MIHRRDVPDWFDRTPTGVKVVILNAVAAAPLLAVGLPRHPGWSVATFALNLVLGTLFFSLVTGLPRERLQAALVAWRGGEAFQAGSARLPAEYASLANAIQLATDRLSAREAELREATDQQALLMQEIHHRVKNNLQIVASLLNLQSSRIKVPAAQAEFQSARDRVRALATLHRHLYAHGELQTIAMHEFLSELCGQLFTAFGETPGARIDLRVDAPELEMSSDQAVPLALIVTEAVSNAVKFAFPDGRRGAVNVHLSSSGDEAELIVADDGVGLMVPRTDPAAEPGTDPAGSEGRRDGIGLQLIRGFARQLGGTLDVRDGTGTSYVVRMKLRRERPVVSAQGFAGQGFAGQGFADQGSAGQGTVARPAAPRDDEVRPAA